MKPEEEKIRNQIQSFVKAYWKTEELWTILEEFEDDLEKAAKGTKDDEDYKMIMLRIASRSLIAMREIIVLCEAGYSDGAFSIARTLYEQCIHILFFLTHEKDESFNYYVVDYLLNGRYQIYKYNSERIKIDPNVDKEKLQEELQYIKSECHHQFPEERPNDYWWAGKTSFWGLVDEVKKAYQEDEDKELLEKMHLLYIATNRTIHANAAGNAQRIGQEYESNVINTAPNWTGQGYPLYFSTICMTIIMLYLCDKYCISREKYYHKMNEFLSFYISRGYEINEGLNKNENKNQPE